MRYDLNYITYSSALISKNNSPDKIQAFVDSTNIGLNILITDKKNVVLKHPKSFFPLADSVYVYSTEREIVHPYFSYSDFYSISDSLGLDGIRLPKNVQDASFGVWEAENNKAYAADFIETREGYKYYIITNFPYEDSVSFSFLSQGFLIGVGAIIVFVVLIYVYIRARLRPIQLMKQRLLALEKGDLESKIQILGTDELAELSVSFNRLISEIKVLINEKHNLLLDVSHELKSPLARMLLLIEMIPKNKQTAELQEEIVFLNDMISNLLLTDKLDLPYSKLDIGKVEVGDLFQKIIHFFNDEQQNKIHFTNNLSKQFLYIDLTKMIVCIKNIVQNAFKYANTKEGVSITIYDGDECRPDLHVCNISIRDFGEGIPEEEQKKIFESFFRSSNFKNVSGFGLGLSISKKIIKSHMGEISLNSKVGVGSEFILSFPIIADKKNAK